MKGLQYNNQQKVVKVAKKGGQDIVSNINKIHVMEEKHTQA